MATAPATRFVELLARDVHPPGYYLLLSLWTRAAGTSEIALRTPSVVAGTATVVAVFAFGRKLCGARAGLLAAALLALSPFHVFYSQEARSYALLTLLVVVSSHALVIWLGESSRGHAAVWTALTLLALSTHYIAVLVVLAHTAVWLVGRLTGTRGGPALSPVVSFRQWAVANGVVVLAFIPGLILLAQQIAGGGGELWISPPTLAAVVEAVGLQVGLRSPGASPPGAGVLLMAMAATLVWLTLAGLTRFGRAVVEGPSDGHHVPPVSRALAVLGPCVVVPPLAILVLSWNGVQILTPRNLIVILPFVTVLVAAVTLRIPRVALRMGVLALVLAAPVTGLTALVHGGLKEEWRDAAHLVQAAGSSDDAFVYDAWFARPAMEYALGRQTRVLESMPSATEPPERVWLIRSHSRLPEATFARLFSAAGFSVALRQRYRGVEVILLERAVDTRSTRARPSTVTTSSNRGAANRRSQPSEHE